MTPIQDTGLLPVTQEALKPCPFCGGHAIFIGNGVNSKVYGIVCCYSQDCLGYHWPDGEYGGYTHATSKAEAIAAWNTRAEQPKPSGERAGEVAKVGQCLAFFASVIKSGEPWTATCQRDYDAAQKALAALAKDRTALSWLANECGPVASSLVMEAVNRG